MICCEVHPTARIDIPAGTVGFFFTEYFSENGQRNCIIGELSINISIQFIGLSKIWGSGFPFIPSPRAPDISSGWGSTGDANSNGNPGFTIVTGIWGGSFSNSTMNCSGNWSGYVNSIPCYLLWSPTCSCFDQRLIRNDLLHCRRQHCLWRQFNRANPRVCQRSQNRYFSDCLATK